MSRSENRQGITLVGVCSSLRLLCHVNLPARCIVTRTQQCLATLQSNALVFSQNKSFELSESHPSGAERGLIVPHPSLHLSSPTPSSCCVGLAAKQGFFFFFRFSAGGQSSPESEEMLPCFSPSLSFQPFPAEALSGMVRGAFHFSMRNDGSKLCDRTAHKGPRQHAIPQRLSKLLQLVISEICQRSW